MFTQEEKELIRKFLDENSGTVYIAAQIFSQYE